MTNSLQIMKDLFSSLPNKDIHLAEKYLLNRDFEALYDLVDSAIYKIRHDTSDRIDFKTANVDTLELLKIEIHNYMQFLDVDDPYDEEDSGDLYENEEEAYD